jgi:peptidoglycan hydrolase CwlO-like protein
VLWVLLADATELANTAQRTADTASGNSLTAVYLAAISMVGAAVTVVVAMFRDKHKLQHERKLVELEHAQDHLKRAVADCKDKHDATERKLDECEEQHKYNAADRAEHAKRIEALEAAVRPKPCP